jgi:hypothetical protein
LERGHQDHMQDRNEEMDQQEASMCSKNENTKALFLNIF